MDYRLKVKVTYRGYLVHLERGNDKLTIFFPAETVISPDEAPSGPIFLILPHFQGFLQD